MFICSVIQSRLLVFTWKDSQLSHDKKTVANCLSLYRFISPSHNTHTHHSCTNWNSTKTENAAFAGWIPVQPSEVHTFKFIPNHEQHEISKDRERLTSIFYARSFVFIFHLSSSFSLSFLFMPCLIFFGTVISLSERTNLIIP